MPPAPKFCKINQENITTESNRVEFTLIPVFFQNEETFVQLDELDELDRITHAWIGFNYSLTQVQKTF